MSVYLDKPYGNSEFLIECSTNQYSFDRAIKSITLQTQIGRFEAPQSIFTDLRNPVAVELASFLEKGALAVYITFDYSIRPYAVRPVTIKFKGGRFTVFKRYSSNF